MQHRWQTLAAPSSCDPFLLRAACPGSWILNPGSWDLPAPPPAARALRIAFSEPKRVASQSSCASSTSRSHCGANTEGSATWEQLEAQQGKGKVWGWSATAEGGECGGTSTGRATGGMRCGEDKVWGGAPSGPCSANREKECWEGRPPATGSATREGEAQGRGVPQPQEAQAERGSSRGVSPSH
eukprot:365601-Chlamydomonas_euryale.AAC.1